MGVSDESSSTVSVISRHSPPGGTPLSASALATTSGNSGRASWRPETLTETNPSGWAARSRQACRSTASPSGTTSPLASAAGMKSAGEQMLGPG